MKELYEKLNKENINLIIIPKTKLEDELNLNEDGKYCKIIDIYFKNKKSKKITKELGFNNAPTLNQFQISREEELSKIEECFKDGNIILLHGLAGVGKTQTALQYVEKYKAKFERILIINGQDIMGSCIEIIDELEAESKDNGDVDYEINCVRINEKSSIEVVFGRINKSERWLCLYDNFDNYTNLKYSTHNKDHNKEIDLRAKNSSTKIIITSRKKEAKFTNLEIKEYTDGQSQNYLKISMQGVKFDEAAKKIIQKLGNLPLALSIAVAYMKNRNTSYEEYLKFLENNKQKILSINETDYNANLYNTYDITLNVLSNEAKNLLNVLCCIAPKI